MADSLIDVVRDLAERDPDLPEDAKWLVTAALEGAEALESFLYGPEEVRK